MTVAKLRPQLKPLRWRMNEATALPPTTEGVKAEASSHRTMLEVARLSVNSPRAKIRSLAT